jgi:tetrahydromethanopterin S-methyltransferase subunit G
MAETTNTRLDRIETKLDQLTDAMVMLARAEERLAGLKDDHDRSFERMNRLSSKLDDIERQVQDNANTVRVINKLFWVAVIAIAGSIAAQLWM